MDVQQVLPQTAPREIEIKLDLSAADAATLEASLATSAPIDRRSQYSVYFDTADRRLLSAGLALRIRADGGQLVQTVKTLADGAGLFDRGEWEAPVFHFQPIPDDRVVGTILDAQLIEALLPVFEIEVMRACWKSGSIPVALTIDRATIRAGDRQCSFHELELELTPGEPAAAFALLGQLDDIVPLRVGVLSKAERGYRLLGTAIVAHRAERIASDPASSVRQAFGTIAASCIKHYRLNEQTLLDRHDAEAVHQARVALRRLRSALAIFDRVLDRRARAFDRALRSLARQFGTVRDLDVMLAHSDGAGTHAALRARRGQAYAALAETLRRTETRSLFVDIVVWFTEDADDDGGPIQTFAPDALERAHRRLARRARHFTSLSTADRHRVRMAAKRLHYADDFFAALLVHHRRRRVLRFSSALEKLQDRLGALNDLVVAADLADTRRPAAEARLMTRASRSLDKVLQSKPYWRCD